MNFCYKIASNARFVRLNDTSRKTTDRIPNWEEEDAETRLTLRVENVGFAHYVAVVPGVRMAFCLAECICSFISFQLPSSYRVNSECKLNPPSNLLAL